MDNTGVLSCKRQENLQKRRDKYHREKAKLRDIRNLKKNSGFCVNHKNNVSVKGRSSCQVCLDRLKTNRLRSKALGMCPNHGADGEVKGAPGKSQCQECLSKLKKIHYESRYGLSLEEIEHRKITQNHKCLICAKIPRLLHVDHCHKSGKVRGLLCPSCNKALGLFKDRPENLLAAAAYLVNTSGEA